MSSAHYLHELLRDISSTVTNTKKQFVDQQNTWIDIQNLGARLESGKHGAGQYSKTGSISIGMHGANWNNFLFQPSKY